MEAVLCHFHNWSPDLRPTLVVCFTDSALLQHIVTHIAEHFELLITGKSVGTVTL